jgi:conflict system pore-forming effector with SLATT domain
MTIMLDAAGIIGSDSPADYRLTPVEHAEQLRISAPKLAAVLTRTGPVELSRQYAEADTEALIAEQTFKRWVIRANWAVLATATVSALLMAVALLADNLGALSQAALIALALIGVATGGIASMSLFRVKEGRLLEDWMTARARAETKRLSYFSYITNSSDEPHDPELELLKLEYFRRYQLDLQLAYYKNRRSGHRNSAERTLDISAASVLVAAIATGAAGVLGALKSEWAALGSVAVLGAALQAFAAARESLNQDRRNAERYDHSAQALLGLRERIDEVRHSIAAGSTSVLGEYVGAVQDQLSLEHRQWLEGAENMQAAVARLEKALSAGASQQAASSDEAADRKE